jgi:hypothetical protein
MFAKGTDKLVDEYVGLCRSASKRCIPDPPFAAGPQQPVLSRD